MSIRKRSSSSRTESKQQLTNHQKTTKSEELLNSKDIFIGAWCTKEYERQTFTWSILTTENNSQQSVINQSGSIYIDTTNGETTRGQLIGYLQALKEMKKNFKLRR